ncbi:MAG: phosphatidylserine decarboxylase [Eubacteriales bacterium]|nr:phosphatidylserine decarboxylase [Eubacteriales bacterium]
MKYIDRKGNITIEENSQDKLLRHLYSDWGGRICLKILVRPFISKAAGVFLNTRLSARMVPGFVRRNQIDLSEYKRQEFRSYNDFFTREVKTGARPVSPGENILISPCDGKATVSRIGRDSRFYIKDTEYTVEQLLRNKKLASRYLGGYAVILRLTVDDYHRYCYIADGEKSPNVRLQGIFHTVNPAANDVYPVYKENTREYTLLKTDKFGTVVMMEVGAMMVGKITNHHTGTAKVTRGQEKGYFEFGGSTVVLLIQNGKVRIDYDLLENSENGYETIVRMGERIGECKLSKRTGKDHQGSTEPRKGSAAVSS